MNSTETLKLILPAVKPRSLIGVKMLIVYHSRFVYEMSRFLCLNSGVWLRRAAIIASASFYLRLDQTNVILFDLESS